MSKAKDVTNDSRIKNLLESIKEEFSGPFKNTVEFNKKCVAVKLSWHDRLKINNVDGIKHHVNPLFGVHRNSHDSQNYNYKTEIFNKVDHIHQQASLRNRIQQEATESAINMITGFKRGYLGPEVARNMIRMLEVEDTVIPFDKREEIIKAATVKSTLNAEIIEARGGMMLNHIIQAGGKTLP